jgi:hypothetical protein
MTTTTRWPLLLGISAGILGLRRSTVEPVEPVEPKAAGNANPEDTRDR